MVRSVADDEFELLDWLDEVFEPASLWGICGVDRCIPYTGNYLCHLCRVYRPGERRNTVQRSNSSDDILYDSPFPQKGRLDLLI